MSIGAKKQKRGQIYFLKNKSVPFWRSIVSRRYVLGHFSEQHKQFEHGVRIQAQAWPDEHLRVLLEDGVGINGCETARGDLVQDSGGRFRFIPAYSRREAKK